MAGTREQGLGVMNVFVTGTLRLLQSGRGGHARERGLGVMNSTCAAEEGTRESVDSGCRKLTAAWVREAAQKSHDVETCDFFEGLERAAAERCACRTWMLKTYKAATLSWASTQCIKPHCRNFLPGRNSPRWGKQCACWVRDQLKDALTHV